MRVSLPKFFGFEGLGIMFRDVKSDEYFTIEENQAQEEGKEQNGEEFKEGTYISFPTTIGITG